MYREGGWDESGAGCEVGGCLRGGCCVCLLPGRLWIRCQGGGEEVEWGGFCGELFGAECGYVDVGS